MVKRVWPLAATLAGIVLLACSAAYLSTGQHVPAQSASQQSVAPARIIDSEWFNSPPASAPVSHDGVRVRVPTLGIDLAVVEGDGVNAPLNLAAHYPGMKWPGEGGRSLLYAHARPGMFGPLFRVQDGQEVLVDRQNAPELKYSIRSHTDRWPATDTSVLQPSDHEQLVLLTCTTYNPADPRIVVFAEPLQ
jgi:LPXTG-site transpeptidase (sortase) family protein